MTASDSSEALDVIVVDAGQGDSPSPTTGRADSGRTGRGKATCGT
jgi:hypothetical protein